MEMTGAGAFQASNHVGIEHVALQEGLCLLFARESVKNLYVLVTDQQFFISHQGSG